jgi:protein TonB
MFHDVLIESARQHRQQGGPLTATISILIHLGFIAAIVAAGYHVHEKPAANTPIRAYLVTQAARAAPPPPPPPPAPRRSSSVPVRRVERESPQSAEVFRQPEVVPRELPAVPETETTAAPEEGGMPGGTVGGTRGGTVGGEVGGQEGGRVGGILGSTGTGSGTGTGTAGEAGTGGSDAPLRVAGNVKAPVLVLKVVPLYTEAARIARIRGIVIIEAVIDREGNVTDARILRALPMGLDQAALRAIRQWRFRPGTLNGRPVPVIYNVTVNFELQ